MNIRPLFTALLMLLFFSSAFSQSPAWIRTYKSGTLDSKGRFMGGNEITQIIAHKDKLFAGNSDWDESDTVNNPPACEIVRLDSSTAQWQVDTTFIYHSYHSLADSGFNMNVNAMKSFIFNTAYPGVAITPDTLLIAAPGNYVHKNIVYIRNDAANSWITSTIGGTLSKPFSCRALGFHKDTVSGVCCVFAGIENYGIVKGVYNTSFPGKIQWDTMPEIVPPTAERVMGFTVCNNILYAASSQTHGAGTGHIYERTDGTGSWTLVDSLANGSGQDLRGLTAIPNPAGTGEVLWYCWNSKAHRLDPFNAFTDTIEYAFKDSLAIQLSIGIRSVLAAYNDNIPVFNIQNDSEDIRVIGFEMHYDSAALAHSPRPNFHRYATDGRYFVRTQSGHSITYQLKYIVNNTPVIKDTLLSVRSLCVSPFAGDSGKVLFGGGYDCDSIQANRKAWIYRGDFRTIISNVLEKQGSHTGIKVYPNPAINTLTIDIPKAAVGSMQSAASNIAIYNVLGEKVYTLPIADYCSPITVDVANLPNGVYMVKVRTEKGVEVKKFVKE